MIGLALALITATPDTIVKQIAAAQPGDTLVLKGSFAAPIKIANRAFAPALTVDAREATFADSVMIVKTSGVHWSGGTFTNTDPNGYGIRVDFASDIWVSDTRMSGMGFGISFFRSQDLKATRNQIERWQIDGLRVFWSQRAEITDNTLLDGAPVDAVNHHPDAIQLASGIDKKTGKSWITTDVTIKRNTVRNAKGQGITAFHHDGYDEGFDRIVIEDNDVASGWTQGIALYGARSGSVARNKLKTLPGARWPSRINLIGNDRAVKVSDNRIR